MGNRRDEAFALLSLGAIVLITIGWWALALWPLSETTPEWVARTRAACFGSKPSGLPDAGGWLLLIGTPPALLAALVVISGGPLRSGMNRLRVATAGRLVLAAVTVGLAALTGLAGVRVARAMGVMAEPAAAPVALRVDYPLIDRPLPPFALVDQRGDTIRAELLRGRPLMVSFAFGMCETVCPLIVREAREAQRQLEALAPVLLIVTVDPWRDTPSRLPHIAASWQLGPDAHLLSGDVAAVEAALDAFAVERRRDLRTGEVDHPSLVYVVDRDGQIAYAVTGRTEQILEAARRLGP